MACRLALLKRIALMSYYLKFFWACVGCTALAWLWDIRYMFLNPNADYYTGQGLVVSGIVYLVIICFFCVGTLSLLVGGFRNKALRQQFWKHFWWALFFEFSANYLDNYIYKLVVPPILHY
jgi:hypothetical protein